MTTVFDDDDLGVVMAPAAMHPAIVMLGLNDDLGVLRLRAVRGGPCKADGGNGAESQYNFPHIEISSENRRRDAGVRNNPWQVRSVQNLPRNLLNGYSDFGQNGLVPRG